MYAFTLYLYFFQILPPQPWAYHARLWLSDANHWFTNHNWLIFKIIKKIYALGGIACCLLWLWQLVSHGPFSSTDQLITMNSALCSTRKEIITKHLARATSLPAELSRYSKNCKSLCNILRDTKIIINEINTADYLAQGKYLLHYFM